jgi:hypothetical protein
MDQNIVGLHIANWIGLSQRIVTRALNSGL